MRGLATLTTSANSSGQAHSRLQRAGGCTWRRSAGDSTTMARGAVVPVLLLLATSSASPVVRSYIEVGDAPLDSLSTSTLHDTTWRQENVGESRGYFGTGVPDWNSGPNEASSKGNIYSKHRPGVDHTPSEEQNTVQGVSGWDAGSADDTVWKIITSPSGTLDTPAYYEHDEQQPPIVVGKNGSPAYEFTVDPNFSNTYFHNRVLQWEPDGPSSQSIRNDSKYVEASNVKSSEEEMAEQAPARNATGLGPEVGTEEFEQSLGSVLSDTLRKMKIVLAGGRVPGEQHDHESGEWRSALARLRVKRSEGDGDGDAEDSAELPATSLNDIVDVFLIIARQSLEDRGLDQVKIPALERTFSRSLGVGTLRGFFRGDGGWVRRLTTVRRVGDVRLDRGPRPPEGEQRDARSVSVAASLGLEELTVGFERYVADVRALPTMSGRLLADIDENAVLLNISFSKRDDDPKGCDVFLQELQVLRLDGINLKLTGLGPLNWLLSRIATWLTSHSQEKVAAVVENELTQIAIKELKNIPCDADFISAISML